MVWVEIFSFYDGLRTYLILPLLGLLFFRMAWAMVRDEPPSDSPKALSEGDLIKNRLRLSFFALFALGMGTAGYQGV